jgi:GNAT superfamily N-acetyltransferase
VTTWEIQRLAAHHDRSSFDCGEPSLNQWLAQRSGQFDRRDLARTFVVVEAGKRVVLGYYSLTSHRVEFSALPKQEAKGLPRLDVPVALLGRLAVDRSAQGKRLGAFLLLDALRRCQHLADEIGIRAVEVDALSTTARSFYLNFGFIPLEDDPFHLFLPMSLIRKLGLPPLGP